MAADLPAAARSTQGRAARSEPIANLDWRFDPGAAPEELARELNGYVVADVPDPNDASKMLLQKGQTGRRLRRAARRRQDGLRLLDLFRLLDGSRQHGPARQQRSGRDRRLCEMGVVLAGQPPHHLQPRLGDMDGNPWDPTRKLIWWDGGKWTGYDVPDIAPTAKPQDVGPFIMNAEGTARLFSLKGMREGPFPVHYEPFEIAGRQRRGAEDPGNNPVARVFKGRSGTVGRFEGVPRGDLHRLTEHFHYWTKHVRINASLQPEFFVEISEAREGERHRGGRHGARLVKRGSVKRAVVTKRIKPLICDGKTAHVVGIPLHWGFMGQAKKGFGPNSLTPFLGDANIGHAGIQGVPRQHRTGLGTGGLRGEDVPTFPIPGSPRSGEVRRPTSSAARLRPVTPPARQTEVAKLIDVSKCIGCKACQSACQEWNDLREDVGTNKGHVQQPADLTPAEPLDGDAFTEWDNPGGAISSG